MTQCAAQSCKGPLERALAKAGLDALLVTRDANQRYLEGYTGSECYLLASAAGRWLLADPRYSEQAAQECRSAAVAKHRDPFPPYAEVIASLAQEHGLRRIGFEKAVLTYGQYETILEALSRVEGAAFLPTDGLVEELRMVKAADEIEKIRAACAIADRGLENTLAAIHEGMSEQELARELEAQMVKAGGEGVSFQTIVAFGARASMPHAVPDPKVRLQPGDFILIDYGTLYQGYHSDTTRTFVFGKASERQKTAYAAVLAAHHKGFAAIRPGVASREPDAVSRQHMLSLGFPEFNHGVGHGVGLEIHELPSLSRKGPQTLAAGMVVTVEPGLYLPGWGGIRIEDTVLVGDSGAESLVHFPKDTLLELQEPGYR